MLQPEHDSCATVARLTAVLNDLAAALAAPDLPAVLAAEPALATLTTTLAALTPAGTDPHRLRSALNEARLAVRRCERLGAAVDAFVSCSLRAQGRTVEYARHGAGPVPAAGHALVVRG
jgi:hypothetical protein